MKTKVKICGITSVEDAINAVEAGADYIGLIFEPESPRCILIEMAKKISDVLGNSVKKVGVFVNQNQDFIRRAVAGAKLDVVQLHGGQDDSFVESISDLKIEIWRVVWVNSQENFENALAMKSDAILIDSSQAGAKGGTGKLCNWEFASFLAREKKVILAGGISAENVESAIAKVSPFAIDSNSGVEISVGKKDFNKVKDLINKVKNYGK